jgi:hypothetical protein
MRAVAGIAAGSLLWIGVAFAAELSTRGDGPSPPPRPFSITREDPGIDALLAKDAKVEFVANGFGLNEGTTWVRDGKSSGFLLVGGLLDNVLYKIGPPHNTVSVFMEKAGFTGDDPSNAGAQTRAGRSHVLLIGPSCSGVDPQGRVLWCADDDRQVMRPARIRCFPQALMVSASTARTISRSSPTAASISPTTISGCVGP